MTQPLHDLVSLYALDMLNAPEKASFETHLRECQPCQAELRELREVSADLGSTVPAAPPASLKDRLMAKVRTAPKAPGVVFQNAGILLARSDELPWKQILPSIEAKRLFVDRERGYNTSLVRIAPGGHYPRHKHKDVEEIFVLSGDLHIEGAHAFAGDYCRSEPDSIHADSYTENGCLFLVVASRHDELLT